MKEKSGTLEILASNSILVEVGKPIEISFGDTDNLTFIFNLISNPAKEKYASEIKLLNEKIIEIDLFNFITPNIGGGGTKYPVKIGVFQNKALYYSFTASSLGNGVQPIFSYTFYLGEEVSNG